MSGFAIDITAQRQVEESLKRVSAEQEILDLNEQLVDRVTWRTAELETANRVLVGAEALLRWDSPELNGENIPQAIEIA